MIRGKKILGALLAFTLCFSMVIPAQADDISDAKKKQQELEQQKNTAEAEKSELSSELDSIVSKMEKTQSDLTAKETEINDAETELVTAKANEDDQYQTMKLRIKYMYENGSNEFLEILMEANSIADLLNKAEYINKISKCDRELLVEQAVSQWASTFAETSLHISKTLGDLAGPLTFAACMGASRLLYGKYGDRIRLDLFMRGSCIEPYCTGRSFRKN